MPILPYCVLLPNVRIDIPKIGVAQAEIHHLRDSGLLALCSELNKGRISAGFKSAALEFHNAVHTVFGQVAVVPFRFPTWLSLPELRAHLQQKSSSYRQFLTEHANDVQIEVRVLLRPSSPTSAARISGTEHLRARAATARQLKESAEKARNIIAAEVREWRAREIPEGLRMYALADRRQLDSIREKLSRRNSEIRLRWSGPWPATEFLPEGLSKG